MKLSDIDMYSLVKLKDGRYGIVVAKHSDNVLVLEPREEDHETELYGDNVDFDAYVSEVVWVDNS